MTADFDTILGAKAECSRREDCTMFFDEGGEGKLFKICGQTPDRLSSSNHSVLYFKRGGIPSIMNYIPCIPKY